MNTSPSNSDGDAKEHPFLKLSVVDAVAYLDEAVNSSSATPEELRDIIYAHDYLSQVRYSELFEYDQQHGFPRTQRKTKSDFSPRETLQFIKITAGSKLSRMIFNPNEPIPLGDLGKAVTQALHQYRVNNDDNDPEEFDLIQTMNLTANLEFTFFIRGSIENQLETLETAARFLKQFQQDVNQSIKFFSILKLAWFYFCDLTLNEQQLSQRKAIEPIMEKNFGPIPIKTKKEPTPEKKPKSSPKTAAGKKQPNQDQGDSKTPPVLPKKEEQPKKPEKPKAKSRPPQPKKSNLPDYKAQAEGYILVGSTFSGEGSYDEAEKEYTKANKALEDHFQITGIKLETLQKQLSDLRKHDKMSQFNNLNFDAQNEVKNAEATTDIPKKIKFLEAANRCYSLAIQQSGKIQELKKLRDDAIENQKTCQTTLKQLKAEQLKNQNSNKQPAAAKKKKAKKTVNSQLGSHDETLPKPSSKQTGEQVGDQKEATSASIPTFIPFTNFLELITELNKLEDLKLENGISLDLNQKVNLEALANRSHKLFTTAKVQNITSNGVIESLTSEASTEITTELFKIENESRFYQQSAILLNLLLPKSTENRREQAAFHYNLLEKLIAELIAKQFKPTQSLKDQESAPISLSEIQRTAKLFKNFKMVYCSYHQQAVVRNEAKKDEKTTAKEPGLVPFNSFNELYSEACKILSNKNSNLVQEIHTFCARNQLLINFATQPKDDIKEALQQNLRKHSAVNYFSLVGFLLASMAGPGGEPEPTFNYITCLQFAKEILLHAPIKEDDPKQKFASWKNKVFPEFEKFYSLIPIRKPVPTATDDTATNNPNTAVSPNIKPQTPSVSEASKISSSYNAAQQLLSANPTKPSPAQSSSENLSGNTAFKSILGENATLSRPRSREKNNSSEQPRIGPNINNAKGPRSAPQKNGAMASMVYRQS